MERMQEHIGSTCSGTGFAIAKRVMREKDVMLAKDIPALAPYIDDISSRVIEDDEYRQNIIIEGTQGYGLSLYHSPYYPFATGRDTTAAAFASEVGISPRSVSRIIMVLRTFPIRVGGNSGPLQDEITWEMIQEESGSPVLEEEYTSVTNRLRRVGRFDWEMARRAARVNQPYSIALMGIDYIDHKNRGITALDAITENARDFIFKIQREMHALVSYIGVGPGMDDMLTR